MPDFTGAMGGAMAMAFAAGASGAWFFCMKTVADPLKLEIRELKERIFRLETKLGL